MQSSYWSALDVYTMDTETETEQLSVTSLFRLPSLNDLVGEQMCAEIRLPSLSEVFDGAVGGTKAIIDIVRSQSNMEAELAELAEPEGAAASTSPSMATHSTLTAAHTTHSMWSFQQQYAFMPWTVLPSSVPCMANGSAVAPLSVVKTEPAATPSPASAAQLGTNGVLGGTPLGTRRKARVPDVFKTKRYYEKRERNNAAARRYRHKKRAQQLATVVVKDEQ